jgi:nucleoside-diphosphate-sugar epimerase
MILVTGATGLVGGNLLWHLLLENEHVTAIRRETSNLEPLHTIFKFYTNEPAKFLSRIIWKSADVLDKDLLDNALSDISIVYHCAAMVSLGNADQRLIETNVTGTRNIVEASIKHNIEKLCFVSSIAACGKYENQKPITEHEQWDETQKHSLYAQSKYYSEQEVWHGIRNGLNAIIVNPGVILGVSGTTTGSSQLFSQVQKGLFFYTNGGSGYVDVQDVAKSMIELTKSKITGERFIVVSENRSNREILGWMADGFGKTRPFIPIGKRLLQTIGLLSEVIGKVFRFNPLIDRGIAKSATNREYYSNEKILKELNFEFKPIENCIKEVCKFLTESQN